MDRDDTRRRPFPYFRHKLYEMVNDSSTDSVVSWSDSGKSFIIRNESLFCGDVLPRYLPYKDMPDFICRLKCTGFKKIESEQQWEYGRDDFVRGHPDPQLSPEAVIARMMEISSALEKGELTGFGFRKLPIV